MTFPKKNRILCSNGNSGGPDIYFFGNFRLFYVRKPMKRDITIEGEIGTNRD